jgi:site-specific DNA-cytosine methylase
LEQALRIQAGLIPAKRLQKQKTAGFLAESSATAGSVGYKEELAPTMKAGGKSGTVLCLNDQGGQRMECAEEQSGTLRAQTHGHEPLVFENHGIDARYTGPHEVSPTMSARYGTGGNNTPLVTEELVYCITGNAIDREPQNGGNGLGVDEDVAFTLTATDHHAVFSRQRTDLFRPDDTASTESARQYKDATDLVLIETEDAPNALLIRRLMPVECERLQGYPDGWTDLPGASDSVRYKALGNSVAIPCVDRLMLGIAAAYQKGLRYDLPQ